MNKALSLFLATGVVLATVSPSLSQSDDPSWVDNLTVQLALEKECKADSFVRLREGTLGTKRFHEARVQCADGRMFDAMRIEPEDKFTIKKCEIVVC